jgi:F0F1-type ATP synthase membrane subunit b/b'
VGILAAVYFFIVKPATDTANHAIDSISAPLQQAEQQAAAAQQQLQKGTKTGQPGAQINLNKLQHCVQKAHQDVNRLQRCAERFGP